TSTTPPWTAPSRWSFRATARPCWRAWRARPTRPPRPASVDSTLISEPHAVNHFQPRTDDMMFILQHVLRAPQQLQALSPHAEADTELMQQVLDESGKFVAEVVAPLNRDGDEIGAQWKDGTVTMPP